MRWRHRLGNAKLFARVRANGGAQRLLSKSSNIAASASITLTPCTALAANPFSAFEHMNETQGVAGLSVIVALVIFSASTAILHLTGRRRWTLRETQLSSDLTVTRAALDRANLFLSAEPQIVVAWGSASGEPDIDGDLSLVMDVPVPRRVLGFGSWLAPDSAQKIEQCVEKLRSRGEGFRLPLVSIAGRHLEAEGRAIGGRAVMRVRDVSGDRLELTQLRERHARSLMDIEALRTMLDALPDPVWVRDGENRLTWANAAYAKAVDASDSRDAVMKGAELLDEPARAQAQEKRAKGEVWRARMPAVVAGERHVMEVIDVPAAGGSAGMALDMSELEAVRRDLGRQMESHARTLDQLKTAVAIFDRKKRLVFHNAEYRRLWSLDAAWLDQGPTDSEILDQLRAARRLPEQADFRGWKESLLAAYHGNDTSEHAWHLPDGRTLRAVLNPNPQGGITYLFDDVTERYLIESQYNALIRVQGETLDTLKEGVAVFGPDGRLKLSNPAFAHLWKLEEEQLAGEPHIDHLVSLCSGLDPESRNWSQLRSIVAGLHDARNSYELRMYCSNDLILDATTAPLSDGATLLTFTDVTTDVKHAQALEEAQRLRDDFVHHVSYELRSPLTNIIGYAELLGGESVGPLNTKQREYAGHVLKSSAALLAIINDILDLATIDNDAMELDLGEVDVAKTISSAVEGIQDRLSESDIRLNVVVPQGIGTFEADANRVRQILFNLLSNAIGFSAPGQTVTIAAMRRNEEMVFKVTDQGRGIPADVIDHVFDRFRTQTVGSRHRGVGLGLSIVKSFVELHDGKVTIDSSPGEGTVVTCIFPTRIQRQKEASETA